MACALRHTACIVVLVVLLLASYGCGTRHQNTIEHVADTNGEHIIGSLKWLITETATGKVLGEGERQVRLEDATFRYHFNESDEQMIDKQIPLSDHFVLVMVESPDKTKSDKTGFGMMVMRDDRFTFSWEWFVVDGENHATKLQESGELAITLSQVGSGWEVTRTEFLSDVDFRIIPFPKGDPKNPAWRVKIFKGSQITWALDPETTWHPASPMSSTSSCPVRSMRSAARSMQVERTWNGCARDASGWQGSLPAWVMLKRTQMDDGLQGWPVCAAWRGTIGLSSY